MNRKPDRLSLLIPATLASLGMMLLQVQGCARDNPNYCESDQECLNRSSANYDPNKTYCHDDMHFCYEGCSKDSDCNDPTKRQEWAEYWNPQAPLVCNLVRHDCVPGGGGDGGVGDGAGSLANGQPCEMSTQCQSKVCTKTTSGYLCCESECTGDALCGNGTCGPKGKCIYGKVGQVCNHVCDGEPAAKVMQCSSTHQCVDVKERKDCLKSARCNPSTGECNVGCQTHDECLSGSVCDRSQAHTKENNGKGECADPKDVIVVSPSGPLTKVAQGISTGKPYVRVGSGTYSDPVTIGSGVVHIMGVGLPTLGTGTDNKDKVVITVKDGADVTLQGLKIVSFSGNEDADGVNCRKGSANPHLVILESTLWGAGYPDSSTSKGEGVDASECDVTLHRNIIQGNGGGGVFVSQGDVILERNTIQGNGGGGVKLSDGTFVVVNNVVTGNGEVGVSNLGGFNINSATTLSFVNNTIAKNLAKNTNKAGIICSGGDTIINSIVWGNIGGGQASAECSFEYSDVEGGVTGTKGNIAQDPQFVSIENKNFRLSTTPTKSPCIDTGTDVSTITTIDLEGNPRPAVKGGKVDMGAYEVQ